MIKIDLPDVNDDGFSLTSQSDDSGVLVRVLGNADMRSISHLDNFLRALHREVTKFALKRATFDMRDLYFMNSSCLHCFVSFIVTADELGGPMRYNISFLSNPKMHWQS